MSKKSAINPAYYENHDFADDLAEAEKTGTLIVAKPGESAFDGIKRYMETKKKTTVSMRLPVGVVNKVRERAATAGVPWTSYISAILEQAMAKPSGKRRVMA